MFNKTIFKQSVKSNFKIWLVITVVLCIMNVAMIAVFDTKTISSMTDMVKDTPIANMLEDTSFIGMLSQTFYTIHGIILPLIYIIIVANSLIVSQVDRGSMAYILSTSTKRSAVVESQIVFLIASLLAMILINTMVGLISIQGFHGGVWGKEYTPDVKVASKVLNMDKEKVADDLTLILENEEALKEGAKSRNMDEDTYEIYLNLKMNDNSESSDKQLSEMQDKIFEGINAASEVLDMEASDLASDMGKIKSNDEAVDAAVEKSGIPKEMFTTIINNQIASSAITEDNGIEFDVNEYLILNIGLFLLMFATSGISFMFSCIFNLSKHYMALGGGIPIAFFLFAMMTQATDSLEKIKYFTLNTLFDTDAILSGGEYMIQFIALAVIGIVLYIIGMYVFKEKDLPL